MIYQVTSHVGSERHLNDLSGVKPYIGSDSHLNDLSGDNPHWF